MSEQTQASQVSSSRKHLSDLHAMLASIERQTDARQLNAIVNHPAVLPWVGMGAGQERLDLSEAIQSPDVVCLLGVYGGVTFHRLQPGLWEAHTHMLLEGRGQWALACVQACLHYLFTRSEAVEIMTRCPKGNLAATALAKAIHGVFEFTNPAGWIKDGKPISADIYRLTIQDWIRTAPGLVERGQWFHERLDAEMARLNMEAPRHPDDSEHDRQVGLACEMAMAGLPLKGAVFYNRYAVMGGYLPMVVMATDPVEIDIGTAHLRMVGEDFMALPRPQDVH